MKKQDLISSINNINLGDAAEDKILNKALDYIHKKERITMSKKKLCVLALAATLAIGVVAYAASGIITSWNSSSSSIPDYKSFPTTQQITKDIGYSPKMIESFGNGFSFADATIVNNNLQDDSGKSVEKFKSVAVNYENGKDEVMLSVDKFNSDVGTFGDIIADVNGIDLYYDCYTNKLVPPNYKLTDEDKKAEENGELVFSYGSDTIRVSKVQGLTWNQDGIQYNFTQIDGALSPDELVEMAKEIIDK